MSKVSVRVVQGDALALQADVLVMKYAQARYGLDALVLSKIEWLGKPVENNLPAPESFWLTGSFGIAVAPTLLFVGIAALPQFSYADIRSFGRRSLAILEKEMPGVKKVAMTIHGVGLGLDEEESFKAQVAGILEALQAGDMPPYLEEVVIVERHEKRVERLNDLLHAWLPKVEVESRVALSHSAPPAVVESMRMAGIDSEAKPFVFVAMPFSEAFDDIFHYGIKGACKNAGFLCERADHEVFTGDIMDWMKQRIQACHFVIAELTGANANVYLEVGYAWGVDKPTILLIQKAEELKFDVQGMRAIIYTKISELEQKLTQELAALKDKLGI